MHIERLVEGVFPIAMKSKISQSVQQSKVNIHPIHLLPQNRHLQQLWELETLHLRPQNELVKAASAERQCQNRRVSSTTHRRVRSPLPPSGHVSPREPLEPVANWSVLGACHQASALSESWCNTQTDVVVVARTQGNTRLTNKHMLNQCPSSQRTELWFAWHRPAARPDSEYAGMVLSDTDQAESH